MPEPPAFYYATTDPAILKAVLDWRAQRLAWGEKMEAIANRFDRVPVYSQNITGLRFTAFTRRAGEPDDPRAWKDTMWVLSDGGHLRPRLSHRDGKKLDAEMRALGTMPHPAELLTGIPKTYGFLGRPGIEPGPGQATIIATYGQAVKHDERWQALKASQYWQLHEARQAEVAATRAQAVPA